MRCFVCVHERPFTALGEGYFWLRQWRYPSGLLTPRDGWRQNFDVFRFLGYWFGIGDGTEAHRVRAPFYRPSISPYGAHVACRRCRSVVAVELSDMLHWSCMSSAAMSSSVSVGQGSLPYTTHLQWTNSDQRRTDPEDVVDNKESLGISVTSTRTRTCGIVSPWVSEGYGVFM
jgi:hypothetical protein